MLLDSVDEQGQTKGIAMENTQTENHVVDTSAVMNKLEAEAANRGPSH